MENQEAYRRARRRADAKISFYTHLAVYVIVNCFLIFLNLTTSPQHFWFMWPLAGWGIGLFFHGMSVFLSGKTSSFRERMIKKEMEKELARSSDSEKT